MQNITHLYGSAVKPILKENFTDWLKRSLSALPQLPRSLLISPSAMRKILLMTVRRARWKRHVKDMLG